MSEFGGFKIPESFRKNAAPGGTVSAFGGKLKSSPFSGISYADLDDPSGAPEKPKPATPSSFTFKADRTTGDFGSGPGSDPGAGASTSESNAGSGDGLKKISPSAFFRKRTTTMSSPLSSGGTAPRRPHGAAGTSTTSSAQLAQLAAAAAVKKAAKVMRQRSSIEGKTVTSPTKMTTNRNPFSLRRNVGGDQHSSAAVGDVPGASYTHAPRPHARSGAAPPGSNPFKLTRPAYAKEGKNPFGGTMKAIDKSDNLSGVQHQRNTPSPSGVVITLQDDGHLIPPAVQAPTIRNGSPSRRPLAERIARNEKSNFQAQQPRQIQGSSSSANVMSVLRQLKALIGKRCTTEMEKYQLLDERDKLMCKLRQLEPSTRVIGTCPDLCPEKERYCRIVQKRVSMFECDENGRFSHSKFIKDYSRSAADQERPLRHELRPGPQLIMSMDYLLLNIADSNPEPNQLVVWYDFLWSRTRAIRKELTQQMLTDSTAVLLVERCARLHIFVSYALCSLDMTEFDQKLNTEHLGKSLQTLRHLYEDLERCGEYCDSEAEFRAYDIMMYLHDQNTMSQALSYRREVRESAPVRLAIELASALQNNNYVRFFRLLRNKATFLQICACHRYFERARAGAFRVLMIAYMKNTSIPFDSISSQLGYDNPDQLRTDAALYGLRSTDSGLVLSGDTFSLEPDEAPAMRKYGWVDEKRGYSLLSRILSGGTPVNISSSVHVVDSFDESGVYSRDPVVADVLSRHNIDSGIDIVEIENDEQQHKRDEFSKSNQLFEAGRQRLEEREEMKKTAISLLGEEAQPVLHQKCERIVEENLIRRIQVAIANEQSNCIAKIEARNRILTRKQQELEEYRRIINAVTENFLDASTSLVLKQTVRIEYGLALNSYKHSTCEIICKRVWDDLLNHVVDTSVKALADEVYSRELRTHQEKVETIRRRLYTMWFRQFWDQWRRVVLMRKQRRERERKALESWKPSRRAYLVDVKPSTSSAPEVKSARNSMDGEQKTRLLLLRRRRQERIVYGAFCKWRIFARQRGASRRMFEGFITRKRAQPLFLTDEQLKSKKIRETRKSLSAFDHPLVYFGMPVPSLNFMNRQDEKKMLNGLLQPKNRNSGEVSQRSLSPCFTFAEPVIPDQLRNGDVSINKPLEEDEVLIYGTTGSILREQDLDFAREQMERIGFVPRQHRETSTRASEAPITVPPADIASATFNDVQTDLSSINTEVEEMKAQVEALLAKYT